MSKAKLKDQIIYLENKLANKENELQKTLKSFDEIRDELTYYKGFHDGVKNGAKVNFSPTINQQPKKEFESGGFLGNRCAKHAGMSADYSVFDDLKKCDAQIRDEKEFVKKNPRPETVDNIMDFSAKLKEAETKSTETKTEPVSNLQRIFENFIGSDAKGLIICAGEPPNEVLEALESALEKVPKTDDEQLKQTPENNDGLYRRKGTTACNPD